MIKKVLIKTIILLFIYSTKSFAQLDNPIGTIKFDTQDTVEEKNIMNLTRDTVFCFFLESNSKNIIDSDKFYLKQGKVWISYNSENKLIEKGKFKKWKPVRFYFIRLLFRPSFWSKAKRKIEHNGRLYLPRVKVGEWYYLDENELIIYKVTFNRLGWVISKSQTT